MQDLTNLQFNEYRRFKTLFGFGEKPESVTVIGSFIPFKTRWILFKNHFGILDGYVPQKQKDGKGITTDKKTLKHDISNELGVMCNKTRAYAIDQHLAQLASDMNISATAINETNDEEFEALVNTKTALMSGQIANANYTPYLITQPDLDALDLKADNFNNMIGQSDNAQSDSSVAGVNIDKAIHDLQDDLKILDMLAEHFKGGATTNDFYLGYHNNSVLQNLGVHHSSVEGTAPAGAVIKSETKQVTADLSNHFVLSRLTPGDHTVTAVLAGQPPKSQVVKVKRGQVVTLDFNFN